MAAYEGTITRRMESVLDELEEEFRLCSEADFEKRIEDLRRAEGRSERPTRLRDLYELFDACGIPYEKNRDWQYYQGLVDDECAGEGKGAGGVCRIPDAEDLEDRMMLALFYRYEQYPSPEDYMLRMVNRLSFPEDRWENDPLRVRILKQFMKYGNGLQDAGYGGAAYCRRYAKGKLSPSRKGRPSDEDLTEALDDGVFSEMEKTAADLDQRQQEAGTPEELSQIRREREKLKTQLKPDGKYGLLKLADDLAGGRFRTNGATRKGLYLFAFVYGMTYYTGGSGEIRDYESDIEKNLFQDYYANNLIRFVTEAYRGNRSDFERDPSGQGINYRNFAEMIYLYYLVRDGEPAQRIRLASEMIDRVKIGRGQTERRQEREKAAEEAAEDATVRFRADAGRGAPAAGVPAEDIFHLPEDAFESYLMRNYDCRVWQTNERGAESDIGSMQADDRQLSAYRQYRLILEDLEQLKKGDEGSLSDCNYGLWFGDPGAFEEEGRKSLCDTEPGIDREAYGKFIEFLRAANEFLGYAPAEEATEQSLAAEQTREQQMATAPRARIKALSVESPDKMTRTCLLVAYYYYFNAMYEMEDSGAGKSFEEIYDEFRDGVDEKLEAAYYQPISSRNLFDVLLTFSSYAYLRL